MKYVFRNWYSRSTTYQALNERLCTFHLMISTLQKRKLGLRQVQDHIVFPCQPQQRPCSSQANRLGNIWPYGQKDDRIRHDSPHVWNGIGWGPPGNISQWPFLTYCDTEYICGQVLSYRMCVDRVNHAARVNSLTVSFPGVI